MTTRAWIAALAGLALSASLAAQTSTTTFDHPPTVTPAANATLKAIVAQISAANIHADQVALVGFGTRLATEETDSTTTGTAAARAWLVAQFQKYSAASGGRLQVREEHFMVPAGFRIRKPVPMTNVIATLPGDDPSNHQIFVMGGDYDTIGGFGGGTDSRTPTVGPGANDDASGVAVALELARVMSQYHFPATLQFIAFDGEEEGLYGAYWHAREQNAANQDVVAMIDDDIVGGDNTPGHANTNRMRVYSEGVPEDASPRQILRLATIGGENDSSPREVSRYASGIAALYLPDFQVVQEYRRDRFGRGGDDIAYLQNGFAAVRMTDYYENYDHQHQWKRMYHGVQFGDLLQFTNPSYTANVARVNALTLGALALAPATPAPLEQQRRGWGTHLSWSAVPGAVSYRVLLRPTAAPQWTLRYDVHGTSINLDKSLDDFIMGVVAVGAAGTESLPTIPLANASTLGPPFPAPVKH
ncbi:MAG: M28 family peptidase [Terriglobales bacterium]